MSHTLVSAMKLLLSLGLAALLAAPAQAQIFRSGVSHGHRHHDRGHGDRHRTSVHVGIGYGHGGWHRGHDFGHRHFGHRHHFPRHYGYGFGVYSPRVYHVPSYGYYAGYGDAYPYYGDHGYYARPSSATSGLLLGALAGGIIGHNSGEFRHNGWRGAAWGAGAGWLLGTILDANRRPVAYATPPAVVQPAPVIQAPPQVQAAPQAQPQQITIINNYYNSSSPMGAANGLFGR